MSARRVVTERQPLRGEAALLPRFLPVAYIVVIGLAVSLYLFFRINAWERERLETHFSELAGERADSLRNNFASVVEALHGVQGLYAASQVVERDEFQAFTRGILARQPWIRSLVWLPRVRDEERAAYESAVRAGGLPEFEIRDIGAGEPLRAATRPEYAPVHFTEPLAPYAGSLGYDHMSVPERRKAVEHARDTGELAMTGKTWLSASKQDGILLYLPVYRNGAATDTLDLRRQELAGYTAAILTLQELITRSFRALEPAGIQVTITDVTLPTNEQLVYAYLPPREGGAGRAAFGPALAPIIRRQPLTVGGRTWMMRCQSTPLFFSAHRHFILPAWGVLMGGLLITFLVASSLFESLGRAASVERLIKDRTAALMAEVAERKRQEQHAQAQRAEAQAKSEELKAANERIAEQARTLQGANKKLQEMAALKDEFVAKASHELRTPLTSIKEGLSLLIDQALGPTTAEQLDFLKTMDTDIDRLTELINNMLDIAKIEAGRMRLLRTRMELSPVLQSLIRSYQPIAGKRALAIERNGAVPPVFADSNRLLQVLTNLLSNAMKFTPEDGRITFRLGQEDGMVSIAVQDSGTGISGEDLNKLFQKFSQVGAHPSGQPRGTGLGLVVCKELIELHGGRIDVSSELGRGTTFTIRLPVYSDAFAVTECFEEQVAVSNANEGRVPVMVIIDAEGWLNSQPAGAERAGALARLAVAVRQCLHRGDSVLSLEGASIAVIAAADRDGAGAIVRRLQDKLPESHRLRFGAAMPPQDGGDALALLRRATARLSHNAAQVLQ